MAGSEQFPPQSAPIIEAGGSLHIPSIQFLSWAPVVVESVPARARNTMSFFCAFSASQYVTNLASNYVSGNQLPDLQSISFMKAEPSDVTALLHAWRNGDAHALERLTPLVYEQLRRLARRYMARERGGHSLQNTALVHEAFLRLVDARTIEWQDRTHFFAVSAQIMRRILVDAARAKSAAKRGGDLARVEHSTARDIDQIPAPASEKALALCALDDALKALASIDARRARVIELRFFGGLSVDETAEVLQVSSQTVMRDWRLARAWLARELGAAPP